MKPLIYLPGMPASNLYDRFAERRVFLDVDAMTAERKWVIRRLEGPDDPDDNDGVIATMPVLRVRIDDPLPFLEMGGQTLSLYGMLRRFGYDPAKPRSLRPLGWDWRKPVAHRGVQNDLFQTLDDLYDETGQPVTVLAHSAGGLVLRALLETFPDTRAGRRAQRELLDRIERVIAIGVPWAGTLKALRMMLGTKGDRFGPFKPGETQNIAIRSHTIFDLLPPDPALAPLRDAEGPLNLFVKGDGRQTSPLADLRWTRRLGRLEPLARERAAAAQRRARADYRRSGRRTPRLRLHGYPLEVINFVGWGAETLVSYRISVRGGKVHLKPTRNEDGDATIPRRSAAWLEGPEVTTFWIPIGVYPGTEGAVPHGALWRNPPLAETLEALLRTGRPRTLAHAAVDGDDAVRGRGRVRVRIVFQSTDGRPPRDARIRLRRLDPDDPREHRPDADGRLTITLRRDRIRQPAPKGVWFDVEFRWREDGAARLQRRSLLIAR